MPNADTRFCINYIKKNKLMHIGLKYLSDSDYFTKEYFITIPQVYSTNQGELRFEVGSYPIAAMMIYSFYHMFIIKCGNLFAPVALHGYVLPFVEGSGDIIVASSPDKLLKKLKKVISHSDVVEDTHVRAEELGYYMESGEEYNYLRHAVFIDRQRRTSTHPSFLAIEIRRIDYRTQPMTIHREFTAEAFEYWDIIHKCHD